jgi:thioredoxin reductase
MVDGRVVPQEAMVIGTRLTARSDLLESLGLDATAAEADGQTTGSFVAADADGRTSVPGGGVAGNLTDLAAQVMTAAAGGLRAAAAINTDLVDEDVEAAVAERRKSSA